MLQRLELVWSISSMKISKMSKNAFWQKALGVSGLIGENMESRNCFHLCHHVLKLSFILQVSIISDMHVADLNIQISCYGFIVK